MNIKITLPAFCFLLLLMSIVSCSNKETGLKDGIWRATLNTESGVEIPFNFLISDSAGRKVMHVLNASERIKVDEIVLKGDSVYIQLPFFDSEIKAATGSPMRGTWIKHLADRDVTMEFNAEHGVDYRFFKAANDAKVDVSGKWSTVFLSEDKQDTTIAIGEFKQSGNKLTGTFLTSTGDYRFLEGTVSGNKLYLSTFNGSSAYLFTGEVGPDNTIINGKFHAGLTSIIDWTAKKDNQAILPDSYAVTSLKPGYSSLQFSFPNLDSQIVSLSDPKFKNKVVVVQFLGSWCPNCIDETAYLSEFYKRYKDKGVEVVGLAYERTNDFKRSHKNLTRLKDRFNIDYEILITGYTNKEVDQSFPMLSNFSAFPTTIIIDKDNKVRKIHSGFNGPGTGDHYTTYTREFEQLINDLLKEG